MTWQTMLKGDYEIEGPEELVNSIKNATSIDQLKNIVHNAVKFDYVSLGEDRPFNVSAIDTFLSNLERNGYSNIRFITRRYGLRQRVAELLEKEGMIVGEGKRTTTVFDPKHENYERIMRRFREDTE
jgi:hypothetical protein